MRREFVLAVMVVVLATSASLLAQDEKTGFESGPLIGQQNGKAKNFELGVPQVNTRVNLSFRYNDHVAYGIRANFFSKGHNAGELSYAYQTNTARIERPSSLA